MYKFGWIYYMMQSTFRKKEEEKNCYSSSRFFQIGTVIFNYTKLFNFRTNNPILTMVMVARMLCKHLGKPSKFNVTQKPKFLQFRSPYPLMRATFISQVFKLNLVSRMFSFCFNDNRWKCEIYINDIRSTFGQIFRPWFGGRVV